MLTPGHSDRSSVELVRSTADTRVRRGHDRESGQAMVEFALILFPLLIVVAGIIYFGIGLNYWLDMQRIANQGARWAAVNNWPPDCPPNSGSCTGANTLQATLKRQAISDGLEDSVDPEVCYPGGTENVGDPVRVRLTSDFSFFFIDTLKVTLVGEATMRLEQKPELITGELTSCP